MLKKINFKNIFKGIFLISFVCVIKGIFLELDSVDINDYASFVKIVLVLWTDSQILNLIWLLPILIGIDLIAKKYYFKINSFDMRYKNKINFINKFLISVLCYSIFINFFIALIQVISMSLYAKCTIIINSKIIFCFVQYIIETTLLNLSIILFAIYFKKFMYVYVIYLMYIIIGLILIINLSLVNNKIYLPFINIYYENKINYISIAFIVMILFLIKRKYIRSDILGGNE